MLETPVVFIFFNRPETTRRTFERIAQARPRKLLLVADGPRPDRPEDIENVAAARAVAERVDWECEVLTNYSDVNLGCGQRPASGIRWAFEHVEEAIILEDDCLPHPSFFRFCSELLKRYRHDERIMVISGSNFLFGQRELPYSYFFCRQLALWGWATWRRAWAHQDRTLALWPELRATGWLSDILGGDRRKVRYWSRIFDRAHAEGEAADDWDYQWTFNVWAQNGLGIGPSVNLISNTGCGPGGTHTLSINNPLAALPTSELGWPLRHPPYVVRDHKADEIIFRNVDNTRRRWRWRLRRRAKAIVLAGVLQPIRALLSYRSSDRAPRIGESGL